MSRCLVAETERTTGLELVCETERHLLDAFGECVRDLISLQQQQFRAIREGDSSANRFDFLIHLANERNLNAKYAYMLHCERHGCLPEDI